MHQCGVQVDYRSHTGIVVKLNKATVDAKSYKRSIPSLQLNRIPLLIPIVFLVLFGLVIS